MDHPAALLIMIALGGALGGAARYCVANFIGRRLGDPAWGIFAVNVSGAMIVGLLAGILLDPQTRLSPGTLTWVFLAVGLMGSYTTVSSLALQTLSMLHAGRLGPALSNTLGSLIAGLIACTAGFWLAGVLI